MVMGAVVIAHDFILAIYHDQIGCDCSIVISIMNTIYDYELSFRTMMVPSFAEAALSRCFAKDRKSSISRLMESFHLSIRQAKEDVSV